MVRWVFVTGGVLSGLGKGMVAASLSKLLQARGHAVTPIKCDGYLNVDPGTMNPHEHGEVYVLADGGEVDMDFGHYERFLNVTASADWNLTSGKVFQTVIGKERHGDYLGETVQIVPHVTQEIKDWFRQVAADSEADIITVEVGGTVGDIENMIYLEAIRQLRQEHEQSVLVHTTLVPFLDTVGEQKTKPTQHSVKELERAGLQPDLVVGRSTDPLEEAVKEKIALFCDVGKNAVISNPDLDTVYRLPLVLQREGLDQYITEELGLPQNTADLAAWEELVTRIKDPAHHVTIGIAGKYTDIDDAYASINEALKHAAAHENTGVTLQFTDTTDLTPGDVETQFQDCDGILIAPGFGSRGTQGKINVARYCRENKVPTVGICFGLQMMIVEYARTVAGLEEAHSTEVDEETPHPVIDVLPDQADVEKKGGTMRLGGYTAHLKEGSQVHGLYQEGEVVERHRHRYEVNPAYHDTLQEHGLVFAGTSQNGMLVEYIELPSHPFYIGTQAHPEFNSQLEEPNPLYHGFIKAVRRHTPP